MLRGSYASVFRGTANVVAAAFGGSLRTHFEEALPDIEGGSPNADTAIVFEVHGNRATKLVSSGQVGFLPTSTYAALLGAGLAVGLGTLRRSIVGLLAVQVYVGGRLLAIVLYGWSQLGQRFPIGTDSLLWERRTSDLLRSAINVDRVAGMFFLVPLVCWAWSAGLEGSLQAWLSRSLSTAGDSYPPEDSGDDGARGKTGPGPTRTARQRDD